MDVLFNENFGMQFSNTVAAGLLLPVAASDDARLPAPRRRGFIQKLFTENREQLLHLVTYRRHIEAKKTCTKYRVQTASDCCRFYLFMDGHVTWEGGPGAAVEPTVYNRKVPGSSLSLCIFVWVRLEATLL